MPDSLDDASRLQAVLARYEQPLIGYAARITGDVELARDVVQDTLLAFISDGAPRDLNSAPAWLFRVCRNRAISVRRKEKRVQPLTCEIADARIAGGASPADGIERDDETAQVLALVAELPERQQEAVRLRFHAGLSYREIAEVLETTTSNVGVMLHAALSRLRARLSANEPREFNEPSTLERGRMS